MKTIILAAVSAAALTGLAAAAPASAAPAASADVEIRDAVARVIVIVEDRQDVGVEITQGSSGLPALRLNRNGGDVRIDGGLGRNAIRDCSSGPSAARQPGQGASVEVRRVGRVQLEEAPMIVLRTPRDVEVSVGGAVFGAVGRGARSIDLGNGGCGDWSVANTDGDMALSLGGSGTIRAGTSRALEANVGGSGSISAGATRALEAAVGGSGGITVARVDGPAEVAIGGSGNVRVRGGAVTSMDASIAGSGNVRHDGSARDLDASIAGSGNVQVGSAEHVSRSTIGSGSVIVGR